LLQALCSKEERFKGNVDILVEGAAPRSAFVVTRGMACRYRLLPDGQRQILTFLIPGDFIDMHFFLLNSIDHFIGTIGRTRLAAIDRGTVIDIVARHPRLKAAFWWSARQEDAMLRERIVALGRRTARGRVAYLLCELVWRQRRRRHPTACHADRLGRRAGADPCIRQSHPAGIPARATDHVGAPAAYATGCREAAGHFRTYSGLSPARQDAV
jgi:CRP-like cAMP-binding protein